MSCQCSEIWRERYVCKKQARTDTLNPSSKLFLRASPNYDCDERFCYELLKAVFISIVLLFVVLYLPANRHQVAEHHL
jgi:hypothetical protein